jgi:hypothetical protein
MMLIRRLQGFGAAVCSHVHIVSQENELPLQVPKKSILILPESHVAHLDLNYLKTWSKIFKMTHSTPTISELGAHPVATIFVGNHSDPLLIWPKILQMVFDFQFRENIMNLWHGIEISEQGSLDQLHLLIRPVFKTFKLNHVSAAQHITKVLKKHSTPTFKTPSLVQFHLDATSLTIRFKFSENNLQTKKMSEDLACCPNAQYSSELLLNQEIHTLIRIEFCKPAHGIIQLKDQCDNNSDERTSETKEAS